MKVLLATDGSDQATTALRTSARLLRRKPGLGPVASRVVAAAPGAVLIGRELREEGRQWRVLAAVDGSLASDRVLEVMASSLQIS